MLTLIYAAFGFSVASLVVSLLTLIAYPNKDEREEEIKRVSHEEELKRLVDQKRRYR
jgi:hypothetical protein